MTEYPSVDDAKKAIAYRFFDLQSRNQALQQKDLIKDLRAKGVPWQIAESAIKELLQAGLLVTCEQRLDEIRQQNAELRSKRLPVIENAEEILEGEVLISREQWPAIFAIHRQPSDALIASEGLTDLLAAQPSDDSDDPQAAVHSLDFRSVNWFGVNHSFGASQAACVKVLWAAWERGTPDVSDETLLLAVDSVAPPRRLRDVFRKHDAWGTMIVEGGSRGSHRFAELKKL